MAHTAIGIEEVRAAAVRIASHVHRTPVVTSRQIDELTGATVFVKAENLQKVGAFKARGATNAVLLLPDELASKGVVTHSSGNHGAALAYAASRRGVPCAVVMPTTAPAIKAEAVRSYGADVVFCEQGEREATCARIAAERGAHLVHPFENPDVIAGQGTAALELLEDVSDLDVVITPVGGGGLCAGTAITVRAIRPQAEMIGAEPLAVDDAARSMSTGIRQPRVERPVTSCDGLMTNLGELNFAILQDRKVEVLTADESEILAAARFHLERTKQLVEPSGAVPLAVMTSHPERFRGKRVGLIVTGGNTDLSWLCRAREACPRA